MSERAEFVQRVVQTEKQISGHFIESGYETNWPVMKPPA